MISLGVATTCWHVRLRSGEVTLEDVVRATSRLGAEFTQIELDWIKTWTPTRREMLAGLLHADQLELITGGGAIGSASCGDSVAAGVDRIGEWIRQTAALGGRSVMIWSGCDRRTMIADRRVEIERQHLHDVLVAAGREAASSGVEILLENVADFRAEELAELIVGVGSPQVGVFLDVTNPHLVFEDPGAAIACLAPHASAGHVKDFHINDLWPERATTSEPVDDPRRGWQVVYCYPGEGATDLEAAMSALCAGRRDKRFMLAVEGLDSRLGVDDQPARVGASLRYLSNLVSAIGDRHD